MSLFDYFKRKNHRRESSKIDLKTATPCYACGMLKDKNSAFCPHCGAKSFDVYEYLQGKGLKQYADQEYRVLVQVNDGPVITCSLLGKQDDSDVLQLLQKTGYLNPNNRNRIYDWPSAKLRIYKAACVCELEKDKIYHVISQDVSNQRGVCLYGCPNTKSISDSKILSQMEVRVVDYEKR